MLSVFPALSPDIVMKKDFYPPSGGNIFMKEHVALLRFELRFLYRQHGSKCASLLNFSERFFGASAKSIRYSA